MKKKFKLSKIVYILFIIIFSTLAVYSLMKILIWKKDNNKNKIIKETLQQYVVVDKDEKYNIDFDGLSKINSDVVGYVNVDGTNIDYVVVKGNNNSYYLNHNFNKEKNISGWIFADYKNKIDGTDKNLVIYGHNTADDSMFGTLKNTITEEWYLNKDNHKVMFITKNAIHYYDVFSTYKIDNEEYYITTDFATDDDYKEFLNVIKNRSVYDYGVDVNENDTILTLSSCANLGKKRIVLHAKKIS
ncbi:MAG: class B sortase [Bacilli bacterium]|nr:class B sortase [Bacilli bacterium]